MDSQKSNKNDSKSIAGKPAMKVVVRARVMNEQQKQRLSTAVDALLTEWVRQEISRIHIYE